jgi:hypothetical protein
MADTIINHSGRVQFVNDENVDVVNTVAAAVSSHIPHVAISMGPRTPLAKKEPNIMVAATTTAADGNGKTPTKSASKMFTTTNNSARKVSSASRQHHHHHHHHTTASNPHTPVRALNESLFEVVVESPRDVKIRELTRMVKAFKQDARYIRDIYSEEIEGLRHELAQLQHGQQQQENPQTSTATVTGASEDAESEVNAENCFGINHANSIISEAESIIAMAEAMLQANKSGKSNATAPTSATPALPAPAAVNMSEVRSREREVLKLKEEIFNYQQQRKKDQQKMHEMEIVMRGMASKLEEYAKANRNHVSCETTSNNGADGEENWTSRVISFFS